MKRKCFLMEQETTTAACREIRIGGTLYRVTSVFNGDIDLRELLEQLVIRRAMTELTGQTENSRQEKENGDGADL